MAYGVGAVRNSVADVIEDLLKRYDIDRPPVDIFGVIRRHGIAFFELPLQNDVSGVLDLRVPKSPKIIVNELHHMNRKRFSAAHELGHYVLHSKVGLHMDKRSFFRNSHSGEGIDRVEIEANQFAAEVLMPRRFLIGSFAAFDDLIDSDRDVICELAQEYQVSATAMSIRSQSLLRDMGFTAF